MNWRSSFGLISVMALAISVVATGCRHKTHAKILRPDKRDMVGTTGAGAETFKPLVEAAMCRLLERHTTGIQSVGAPVVGPMRICFVGVENKSAEEIGDFKEQIYEHIDTHIEHSHVYRPISKRYVDAALRDTGLRSDELFLPKNMREFAASLEQQGQPVDYLLYAKITSGTTRKGNDMQRDYVLTLELVNVQTGAYDKESAAIRKKYDR
jgi:hypothetical protein